MFEMHITPDHASNILSQLPRAARDASRYVADLNEDGTQGDLGVLSIPDEYAAAAEAADPDLMLSTKRIFTLLEFMDLFTEEEQGDLLASALAPVRKFMWMAAGAQFIDLGDERTAAGITALASLGILTNARRDAVLSGNPPA